MKRPNEWDWDNKTAQSSTINNLGFGEDAMRHQARNEPKLRNNNSEPVINMNFGGDEIAQMKYKQTFDNVNQKFSRDGYVRPQTSSNQPDKQIYSQKKGDPGGNVYGTAQKAQYINKFINQSRGDNAFHSKSQTQRQYQYQPYAQPQYQPKLGTQHQYQPLVHQQKSVQKMDSNIKFDCLSRSTLKSVVSQQNLPMHSNNNTQILQFQQQAQGNFY